MMDALRKIPALAGVPDEELRWLSEHGREQRLEEGEFFFREGDPADRFYIVIEGELQVSRKANGQDVIMGTTPPGIMAGEVSLLNR